ncbi:hypothetical protein G6011_09011 [Alternaria panax]|uniref:Uncharacterized protein n=1 Tax=Alternaria panax TaxID=48097 RepID=A0AAD4IAA3_9PLEO|nr:hypothetical protein G6011_09011 [Alternaria panax]
MLDMLRSACAQTQAFAERDVAIKLVQKFVALAQTLESSKAVAFSLGTDGVEIAAWTAEEKASTSGYPLPELISSPLKRPASNQHQKDFLHPLLVALLAFKLGGPVNAAFTTYQHEWRVPSDNSCDTPNLHTEGDSGNIFEDLRITVVWEMRDGEVSGLSGNHTVFLTGDATPWPLVALRAQDDGVNSPVAILYDCGHAALYYDCDNPDVIRKSISVDLHLNSISDEDLQLLDRSSSDAVHEKLTLTKLVTEFPIAKYATHFHNILFDSIVLDVILTKLEKLSVPSAPTIPNSRLCLLEERFEMYKKDNWAHLPLEVKRMESDVYLEGAYLTAASFLDDVVLKARRDVHLPVGVSLFPQSPVDENLEGARKFIRDLPKDLISTRLAYYTSALADSAYTIRDLISTANLHKFAKLLEWRCLELIGIGFIDHGSRLPSMTALACAFGNAINGLKEVQIVMEPWIQGLDLQVYRTRCLYLFWCADFLVCYLVKPVTGPYTIIDTDMAIACAQDIGREVHRMATVFLRNWIAWGLFVEGLPQRGFFVRRA